MDGLDAALRVAAWLRTRATGGAWPSIGMPEGDAADGSLAWGPAGVVLFLLRAYETLGDETLLVGALPGLATVAAQEPLARPGLYHGAAGRAYVIAEAYRVSGEPPWHDAAVRAAETLPAGGPPDVFDGAAGAGLVLLELATTLGRPSLAERAYELAAALAARAEPVGSGVRWVPDGAPDHPNFAHGTAGVGFFLALAGQLPVAVAAGEYLASLASFDGGRCEVPQAAARPGVFWANWCHGPAGTVRLWSALADRTGDERWAGCRDGALRALLDRLLPGGVVRGLGDDASLCCGSAGIADALLDALVATGRADYAAGLRRTLAHVARCSAGDGDGLRWPIGNRLRTGWLGGAAGKAYVLLRAGAHDHGLPPPRPLPDSPAARLAVAS